MSFVSFCNVNLAFAEHQIFDNFNFTLQQGQRVALLGASGIGKSSLLKLLTGIYQPDTGSISCQAKRIGYVFQEPRLLPWLTVSENLAQVLSPHKYDKAVIAEKITAVLDRVELSEFANHYPRQLSGGMAQRVSLARALVIEPDLLLMDEPLSALDNGLKKQLSLFITEYLAQSNASLLYVSHAANEALPLVDSVLLLQRGEAPQFYPIGSSEQVSELLSVLT